MIADLDTLLTALHVELTDRIIPTLGLARSGPGRPPEVTNVELACQSSSPPAARRDKDHRDGRWSRKRK